MASETVDLVPQTHGNLILSRIKNRLSNREELFDEYESLLWKDCPQYILSRRSFCSRPQRKLHVIQGNAVCVIITNYPTVNYLNLEESVIIYNLKKKNVDYSWHDYIEENVNHNPLVEDSEDKVLRYYVGDYPPKFLKCINVVRAVSYHEFWREHVITSLLCLLKRWDVVKYMDLLQKWCLRHSHITWYDSVIDIDKMFLRVLMACCKDSSVVVRAVNMMAQHSYVEIDKDTANYIFLLCHLQRTNLNDCPFNERMFLLGSLTNALVPGDIELMKLYLELEYTLGYSNPFWLIFALFERRSIFRDFRVDPKIWPRKKDQASSQSFYSTEFYAAFTHLTIWTAMKSILDIYFYSRQNSVQSFKLLWRAVPTPHLPIEDMQRCINFDLIRTYLHNFRIVELDERTFWSETVAEFFDDDSSTVFKPRSLKHLSRCAARRQFRSPEQISLLAIPRQLKKYLLLEF